MANFPTFGLNQSHLCIDTDAMAIDRGGETTVQLLTLLNVSATKSHKRKWVDEDLNPRPKLNKRRSSQVDDPSSNTAGAPKMPLTGSNIEASSAETVMDKEEDVDEELLEDEDTLAGMWFVGIIQSRS